MRNGLSKILLIFYIFSSEPLVTAQYPLTLSELWNIIDLLYLHFPHIRNSDDITACLIGCYEA